MTGIGQLKLTISWKKLEIGSTIDFAVYTISPNRVTPIKEKIDSLTSFPAPRNIHEHHLFLDLANHLGGFIKNLTSKTDPLRQHLKKGIAYNWMSDLQTAFEETIKLLSSPP